MKTLTYLHSLLIVCCLLFCVSANAQVARVTPAFDELSSALDADNDELLTATYKELTRALRKIDGKELRIKQQLQTVDRLIRLHPDNAKANVLIYELLRLVRRQDRRNEFTPEILNRLSAFNLLLDDTEMIEMNVELAEKIDKDHADSLANYLRTHSKLTQQLKKVNAEKEALYSTMQDAEDQFENELNETMDSMQMLAKIASLEKAQIANQLKQEQANLALQKSKSQTIMVSLIAIAIALLLVGLLYMNLVRNSRKVKKQKEIIEAEKEKNEALLLNILPVRVAEELKEEGSVKPQYFDEVTVFFADFVDFSKIAKQLTKEQLITDINSLFSIFDDLADQYHIEKIKTIGDAYMCVSGLPDPATHDARKVIQFSEEIISKLKKWNQSRSSSALPRFDIRIGIHTGPLTAGVVGKKKFTYDVWGNTVNTAARMESNSDKNRINISESTLVLVQDFYEVEARGSVAIKNMGEVNMYYIRS